jgi:pimeloyl-ACP methyl ester carboxylesterase
VVTTTSADPTRRDRVALPDVAGVSHRFVTVGDLTLHVAEAGTGPPLLLVHGWPQHWFCWRRLVPLLAEDFRLIMPDLRGFGGATRRPTATQRRSWPTISSVCSTCSTSNRSG